MTGEDMEVARLNALQNNRRGAAMALYRAVAAAAGKWVQLRDLSVNPYTVRDVERDYGVIVQNGYARVRLKDELINEEARWQKRLAKKNSEVSVNYVDRDDLVFLMNLPRRLHEMQSSFFSDSREQFEAVNESISRLITTLLENGDSK